MTHLVMAVTMLGALRDVGRGLREGFFMFWVTLWALVLGFGLSGAVQAFVSRGAMDRLMGDHGPAAIARATGLGAASSSCSYAASAMAKTLFARGADFLAAMTFMFASTNLVVELGIVLIVLMGWQFAAGEFVGGAIMIVLLVSLGHLWLRGRLIEDARARVRGEAPGDDDGSTPAAAPESWRRRIRRPGGWSDAAGYALADLGMLRNEMLIGYLVAGFLAVLVPADVWRHVFVSGHGALTSVENVAVGPFIALISFVCSVGNVPLAAALWKGGISFGGVASFIFADLIALPLLLIYRKLYGGRLALRMLALFWLTMSAAGLAVEALFTAAGLVPHARPTQVAATHFQLNYTTALNIMALVALAAMVWLSRHRERFGGGAGYATDPVCGMQVQTTNAPAVRRCDTQSIYFCSDRCAERFDTNPDRYLTAERPPEPMDAAEGSAVDPICGMTVDPHTALLAEVSQERHFFCSTGCRQRYLAEPAAARHQLLDATASAGRAAQGTAPSRISQRQ
jgi:hypothetical protein